MTSDAEDCVLTIARRRLPIGRAQELVRGFPSSSVLNYDLGGSRDTWPSPTDGLTVTDLGRAVFLNAEISGTDAAKLLDASTGAPWDRVPHWATLEMADPACEGGLYDDALALYDHFHNLRGIGPAKTSKLLHLKRPSLYPIVDQRVMDRYQESGASMAAARANPRSKARRWTHAFWDAIRDDLITSRCCLYQLHQAFTDASASGDNDALPLSRLGPLRLLDIIAWRLPARPRKTGSPAAANKRG